MLAALSDGPSTISGALNSRDTELMIAALRNLGVAIDEITPGQLRVRPPAEFTGGTAIDCGLAGTVMRFIPPLAALAAAPTQFYGDPHASLRPMAGLVAGLRQLGAKVSDDKLPLTLSPSPITEHRVTIDASASSQFISGLLLVGARLPEGLLLRHMGSSVPSMPHIHMTIEMLRDRGVAIEEVEDHCWLVKPGRIAAKDSWIEPDLTNAAVFLAAGAVTGGEVTVAGWPRTSVQPGMQFLAVAQAMGCRISHTDGVTLTGPTRLQAVTVDLHGASELTPVVAAMAASAEGTSRITGVAHIRGHETDRLAALAHELSQLGVKVSEHQDGLEITGGLSAGEPVTLGSYADHRMVHCAAILALTRPGVGVDDLACVAKTMPDFPQRWARLVGC